MEVASLDDRLGRLLALTGKECREWFDAALGQLGSSLPTYLILRHAAYAPGINQRQLATLLGIEGPTLTRHLDRLSAEGLVQRVPNPADRRVFCVELLTDGKAHLDRVERYAAEHDANLRSLFDEHELELLFKLLRRVRDHLGKEGHVQHTLD